MSPAEAKTTTLHLCRALLRAASYLPDEFAQNYIHNYIIHRFRNASTVTPSRLKAARSNLNTLHQAAYGELRPLAHVLKLTYGRIGRRRRELLTPFLRPESTPTTSSCPSEDQARDLSHRQGQEETNHFYEGRPMLLAFVKSQIANSPPTNQRGPLQGLEPTIPAQNSWSRPLPLNRQKNLRFKWWADTLDGLLPPLPEKEWNRLRDLATGVVRFQGPPKRRVRVGGEVQEEKSMLQAAYLKRPIRDAARREKDAARDVRKRHRLTPRFMRRIWADVWSLTSLMSYSTETKQWTVTWGGGRSAISKGIIPSPNAADVGLFEGTNEMSASPRRKNFNSQSHVRKSKPMMFRLDAEELIGVVEEIRISTEMLGSLMERLNSLIRPRIMIGYTSNMIDGVAEGLIHGHPYRLRNEDER